MLRQGHARRVARGRVVVASAFGPCLEAHIALLAGVYRLSRRQVADVVCEIFGCEISVGAVDGAIMRMSRVLADPWRELRDAVRKADAVHAGCLNRWADRS